MTFMLVKGEEIICSAESPSVLKQLLVESTIEPQVIEALEKGIQPEDNQYSFCYELN